VDLVQNRIPRTFGFQPGSDIQVLSPLHRGASGVSELNRRLQEALNPPAQNKPERRRGAYLFRLGDRVMRRPRISLSAAGELTCFVWVTG